MLGLFASGLTYFLQKDSGQYDVDLTELAQCMTDNGVRMYSSKTCSVCARVKEIFGDAFQYVDEVECHPQGENPQVQLCLSKKIDHTPTFTVEIDGEELARVDGLQTPEDLARLSGCEDTLPGLN